MSVRADPAKKVGRCCRVLWVAVLCLAVLCVPAAIPGQAVRVSPVRPQITPLGSITVSATPAIVSFHLTAGEVSDGSSAVNITTRTSNVTLLGSLNLYASFVSSAALTSAEGAVIPSSRVLAATDGHPAYQAFTGNSPFAAGTSVLIFSTSSLLDLQTAQGHQNTLSLRIDLTGAPQQPAGQYTGTLVLQAQAL